ncbi:MAG: lysylphosphatidylglycerol synthase transmembrane domain-containing protein, partial [Acidimicrobiales bacterium]
AATDTPIRSVGRAVQGARNRLFRKRAPMSGLSKRLLEQRDLILSVLGKQWWQATMLSAGRLTLDFLCLYAAVRAVGSRPRMSQVLLVYAVVGVIGLIPITPGGLGIIEAGMTGLLVLVGVDAGQAVLATLAYRLASYWIPLLAGPFAYSLFKWRYRPDKRLVS